MTLSYAVIHEHALQALPLTQNTAQTSRRSVSTRFSRVLHWLCALSWRDMCRDVCKHVCRHVCRHVPRHDLLYSYSVVQMQSHVHQTSLQSRAFVDTFVDTLAHMFVDMFLIYKESCAMETTTGVARSFITTVLVVQSSNSGSVARCRLGRRLCANRGTKVT